MRFRAIPSRSRAALSAQPLDPIEGVTEFFSTPSSFVINCHHLSSARPFSLGFSPFCPWSGTFRRGSGRFRRGFCTVFSPNPLNRLDSVQNFTETVIFHRLLSSNIVFFGGKLGFSSRPSAPPLTEQKENNKIAGWECQESTTGSGNPSSSAIFRPMSSRRSKRRSTTPNLNNGSSHPETGLGDPLRFFVEQRRGGRGDRGRQGSPVRDRRRRASRSERRHRHHRRGRMCRRSPHTRATRNSTSAWGTVTCCARVQPRRIREPAHRGACRRQHVRR